MSLFITVFGFSFSNWIIVHLFTISDQNWCRKISDIICTMTSIRLLLFFFLRCSNVQIHTATNSQTELLLATRQILFFSSRAHFVFVLKRNIVTIKRENQPLSLPKKSTQKKWIHNTSRNTHRHTGLGKGER